jgi:murein hydrolase activator
VTRRFFFLLACLLTALPLHADEALRERLLAEERALLLSEEAQGRIQENLRRLAIQRTETADRLAELERQEQDLARALAANEARRVRLEQEWELMRPHAAARLTMLARGVRQDALEALLSAEGPAEFVYRYHALRVLNEKDEALFERLDRHSREMHTLRRELREQSAEVAILRSEMEEELVRIDVLEALRQDQAAAVREEVEERRAWVEMMRGAARELGYVISALPAVDHAPPSNFSVPILAEQVTEFGEPDPMLGAVLVSQGRRYQADAGTPVYAAAVGDVAFAGWFQGYGNLVILDHGEGVNTLYAHLERIEVRLGDAVEPGDRLGEAGSSGSILAPGLYFEVRRHGEAVDPADWFQGGR